MSRRHKARELLVQALYAAQIGGGELAAAIDEQIERRKPGDESAAFARSRGELLAASIPELDEAIDGALTGWAPERVSVVERCILRLAISELREPADVPPGAVLNEAVELAHDFSGEEAARFVNGVLDRLLQEAQGGDSAG